MSAGRHGRELLRQGFSLSMVVHDYGDVCQSVTDLAVERDAPIGSDDFRTLNRCLDDAIASAVTAYESAQSVTRDGASQELRTLLNSAITAFGMLKTGQVGVGGSTGVVLDRSLQKMRVLLDRPPARLDHSEPQ